MKLILQANSLHIPLAAKSVQCVVTSPPYFGLRSYATGRYKEFELGAESLHDCQGWATRENCGKCYVCHMRQVFSDIKRVLRNDGVCFLVIGDSYYGGKGKSSQAWSTAHQNRNTLQKSYHQISGKGETRPTDLPIKGLKPKDLCGIPWRIALALQSDGWYLRSDIIWNKPNTLPESVKDRPTKTHEYVFLLTKSRRYFWNRSAIMELAAYDGRKDTLHKGSTKYNAPVTPGESVQSMAKNDHERWEKDSNGNMVRNARSVWTIPTYPTKDAHFATFPPKLVERCILAGSRPDDIVLDPFNGSGTTGQVALGLSRHYIGIDLSEEYIEISKKRMRHVQIKGF